MLDRIGLEGTRWHEESRGQAATAAAGLTMKQGSCSSWNGQRATRLAQALAVSADELPGVKRTRAAPGLTDDPEARRLWVRFQQVMALPEKDRRAVIRLVDLLRQRGDDRRLVRGVTRLSEDAFRKTWDNPDDADYDRL